MTNTLSQVGVVVHSGQASGGHYYSYIKQRINEESGVVDKWYRFDDVDVSECNVDQVRFRDLSKISPIES